MLRTTAGVSLRHLAREIEVSPAYLSQVETGKVLPPRPRRIRAIEDSLGVPEGYLLSAAHRLDTNVTALLDEVPVVADFLRAAIQAGLQPSDFQDMIELLGTEGAPGFRRKMSGGKHLKLVPDGYHEVRHLTDYLTEDRVTLMAGAQDKGCLFDELARLAASQVPGLTAEVVREELWDKEREASTGIGDGIAVPHATDPLLERTLAFLVVLDKAVDYQAIDGAPVDVCFFLLAPDSAQREHLELLARIAQVCAHPSFCRGVREGGTAEEVLKFVTLCSTRIP